MRYLPPKSTTARGLASLAALLCVVASTPAAADFFFQPFGYAFHQPIPEPAPDVSPRRIAAILAEEGFRLAGPLGRRGDQVVATGVDRRGRYRRFILDPYEGEILRSWRIEPDFIREEPYYNGAPPPSQITPRASVVEEPLVLPGVGPDSSRSDKRRAVRPRQGAESPARAKTAARPQGAEPVHARHAPPSQATKAPAPAAAPAAAVAPASAPPAGEPSGPASEPAASAPAPAAPSEQAARVEQPPAAPAAADATPAAPSLAAEPPKAPASGESKPEPTPGG